MLSSTDKMIDKIAWIHIKDKLLLCARSKNKELFYIPGGKRELGETDEQTLKREIKEELNIELVSNSIRFANKFTTFADGKAKDVKVMLSCYFADYAGKISPDFEIEEVKWFSSSEMDKCSLASRLVLEWLKSKNMIL